MQVEKTQPTPVNQMVEGAAISGFKPGRLNFLDGLRGLAALGVVLHHVLVFCPFPFLESLLNWGGLRLGILFALSGFSLYLPAASNDAIGLEYGFREMLRRRARRLLPPWYGSLVICVLVGSGLAALGQTPAFHFSPQNLTDFVTHLTLTHSLGKYSGSINPPGYTLGIEWQLSLLLIPFLWLVRRLGWAGLFLPLVAWGLAAEFLPAFAKSPFGLLTRFAPPEFLVPFVMGMFAARLARRPSSWKSEATGNQAWVSAVALSLVMHAVALRTNTMLSFWTAGLFTLASVNLMARTPRGRLTRFFTFRPLNWVGSFCYSLYLIHFPLLALVSGTAKAAGYSPDQVTGIIWASVPLIIFVSWGFHFPFEVPFRRAVPRTPQAVPDATRETVASVPMPAAPLASVKAA